jgi:hypothetical protein
MFSHTSDSRSMLRILFFGCASLILLHRCWSGLLFTGLHGTPLFQPGSDWSYWLVSLSGLVGVVQSSFISCVVLDVMFLSVTIGCMLGFGGRWLVVCFLAIATIYFLVFHSFNINHSHTLVALLICPLPFLFQSQYMRVFRWVRYYLVFIYVSAGIWKLGRLQYFDSDHLSEWVAMNHMSQDGGMLSDLLAFPGLFFILGLIAMICQLLFLMLLFTNRMDLYAIFFICLFHLGTYWLMEVWFFDQLLFALFLIPCFQPGRSIVMGKVT